MSRFSSWRAARSWSPVIRIKTSAPRMASAHPTSPKTIKSRSMSPAPSGRAKARVFHRWRNGEAAIASPPTIATSSHETSQPRKHIAFNRFKVACDHAASHHVRFRDTTRCAHCSNRLTACRQPPSAFHPYGTMMLSFIVGHDMTKSRGLNSLLFAYQSPSLASLTPRLTVEHLEALRRCAKGVTLRFEASETVNALVAGGYANQGVAGVVTVTVRGKEYLRAHTN